MNTDGLKQKMIKSSFWSSLEKVAMEAVSFLVFLVLARLLQPTDYGIVALAMIFVSLLATIAGLGVSGAVIQIRELEQSHLNAAFWASLTVGLVLYGMIFAGANSLATFYSEPALEYVLLCLGLVGLFQAVDAVPRALLSRQFRFRFLALRSMVSTLLGGTIGITMAIEGYGVWALVAQQLSTALVRTSLSWFGAGWLPAFSMSWTPLKRLLSVGLYLMGSSLSNTFSRQADNLLIGTFLGTRDLGIYSIGFKVARTSHSVLLHSLSRLGLPTFSRLQAAPEKLANAYLRVWTLGSALTLPIFILVMVTAPDLVPLLFGAQWQDSGRVLQILMVASCSLGMTNFDSPLLVACGKANLVFRLNVFRMLLNLTGFAIAVQWGINAVAAAFATAAIIMLPVWKIAIQIHTPVAVRKACMPLLSVACGLAALYGAVLLPGILLPDLPVALMLAGQWTCGLVVYGCVVYLLDQSLRDGMRDLLRSGIRTI